MKRIHLSGLLILIFSIIIHGQAVYVDSNVGNDDNPGTEKAPLFSINKAVEIISEKNNDFFIVKINPGIYVINKHITVFTEKNMDAKRIVIEAAILPDDSSWTPDKMPVVVSKSKKGELERENSFIKENAITSFYINESHVTIRGIKFLGYNYPVNVYYPICRFNKAKTDLLIEQCMFMADRQFSVIQVGVIAHGNGIKVDHCVFYNANNSVVYWEASGDSIKTGNSMTNCIVYGATESAIWTSWPDKDFIYKNNIVTNCNYFWIKYTKANNAIYTIDNCVIVNNQHFKGDGENPAEFELIESNVIKEGNILLRMINTIWEPLPMDHLHIIPKTLGYNLGA